jgi:hypothetical protein
LICRSGLGRKGANIAVLLNDYANTIPMRVVQVGQKWAEVSKSTWGDVSVTLAEGTCSQTDNVEYNVTIVPQQYRTLHPSAN